MPPTRMRVLILVKAAPVLTSRLDETICVAGVRLDGDREWVRLHPVPFRDLDDDSRFARYQAVSVDVIRPNSDRRPESWTPLRDTIAVQDSLGTGVGWAARRQVVDSLRETAMCDLVARNRAGSGPGVPSLAVVRPTAPPSLVITPRDPAQVDEWQRRAEAVASRMSLFDDPGQPRTRLEIVPWRFRYHYGCLSTASEF